MSEYQYYDFRAIDKPLTASQRAEVSGLSSCANVSAHRAEFVYNYGDFRGDEIKLMGDNFDMMLYVANWGSRRLMMRFPHALLDVSALRNYFISEELDYYKHGKYVVIDLNFNDEESGGWIDGEDLLDDLLPLRDEILQGDFRALYLAWLKAVENALHYGDVDEETQEPTVPAGLGNLSDTQQQFATFIGLDAATVQVAADSYSRSTSYLHSLRNKGLL